MAYDVAHRQIQECHIAYPGRENVQHAYTQANANSLHVIIHQFDAAMAGATPLAPPGLVGMPVLCYNRH